MDEQLVSIVIPNLNNEHRLGLCLDAIFRQSYPPELLEVIVVDNGSKDQSVALSEQYPVRLLIREDYPSPYLCRNEGIKAAKGTVIALLDSNCVPTSDWLAEGVRALANPELDIVTGPVHFAFSSPVTLAEKIDYLYSVIHEEEIKEVEGLPATHLFIRAGLFDEIGYFLPHVRSLGDIEWTGRAYREGYRFGYAERAAVHYPAKRWPAAARKMVRLGGGRKELWVAGGRSLWHPLWLASILKNFLPPSPAFFREMTQRNERESTKVGSIQLFLGLWILKLLRAWGMLTKKVLPAPAHNA